MEETVLSLIDKRIEMIAEKLEELALRYGPDVIDAALTVVSINGLQQLLVGFTILLTAISLPIFCITIWRKDKDNEPKQMLAVFIGCALPTVLFVMAMTKILNLWVWIAVFNPKLAIAKRVLDGVL